MIRTQIYITEQDREALRELSTECGKKQSELIRDAIKDLITKFSKTRRQDILNRVAGMWEDRKDLPDFSELRSEWDRKINS